MNNSQFIYGWTCSLGNDEFPALRAARDEIHSREVRAAGAAALARGRKSHTYAYEDRILVALHGMPEFEGESDPHMLLPRLASVYLREGRGFLERMRGAFALAIIDAQRDAALLAVDRFGIEGLCYAVDNGALTFASRADVLASRSVATRGINSQALLGYLYFHCVPSPDTIFANQHKLLPAQYVVFGSGNVERGFYWSIPYRDEVGNFDVLKDEFRHRMQIAVQRNVIAERTGAFLSGGTDSSTVAGYLARLRGGPVDTYSIGFAADGYDEMAFARIAARRFGTRAHEYYVTPADVVSAIPLIAAAYDEPFGNASAVPAYYCARMAAADGIEVILAGDGGDEIFGGNARYARMLVFEHYQRIPSVLRRAILEPIAFNMPGAGKVPVLPKLRSYIEQARVPLPDRLETYNFLHRSSLSDIFSRGFLDGLDTDAPVENLREVYRRTRSESALHRMLHLDMKLTLADNDLRKVVRTCELAGVNVRFPMLDEDLVDFAARVPPELKLKGNQLRYFFKQSLTDFLPPEILSKSKHGFGLPFGIWLRDYKPLQELAGDSLGALKKRGFIKASYIDNLLKQHATENAAYYGVMIWVMMMLEQWMQAKRM